MFTLTEPTLALGAHDRLRRVKVKKSMAQGKSLLAKRLTVLAQLTEEEQAYLDQIVARPINIKIGTEIAYEGQNSQSVYIVQHGWTCEYKLLPDGGRQIIAFPVPGDCIGVRSVLLKTSRHSFQAVSDVTLSRIEAPRIVRLFNELPYLGMALLLATTRDEAMIVERLVSLGRRTAIERIAHFFLELHHRLLSVGLATSTEFDCPINQYLLADALGLSAIHVNRMLRELREDDLMTFADHKVIFHNITRMEELAGYFRSSDTPIILRDAVSKKI
jgi:CRP-like cAMP-binding protein